MKESNSQDRIRKVKHESHLLTVSNSVVRDARLSWKARGIHHYLLSLPSYWRINLAHLAEQSEKDGVDSVRSGLKELEALGYVVKTSLHEENQASTGVLWDVYEEPSLDFPETGLPEADIPSGG